MMRNTGSSMQYICIYATICGVTSLLALYGTMEHVNVLLKSTTSASYPESATSSEENHRNNTAVDDVDDQNATAVDDDASYNTRRKVVGVVTEKRLRAIDARMQVVLRNASRELGNFGRRVRDWDSRREKLLQQQRRHGGHVLGGAGGAEPGPNSILLVSSSHPNECENAHGDHLLLKSLKNKVDYCRMHGMELYHNMDMLDVKMVGWWVKLFVIHMLMLARPDVEWLLWVDSDAIFTNMTFELPLERYKDHNMVLHGWDSDLYKLKSWVGLNTGAGVFLLRNCQWSMDLLHEWVRFSPKGRVRDAAGVLLTEAFPDRPLVEAEDQCSLVYLLLTQRSRWGPKVYLENSYHLQGFFEVMTMQPSKFPGMGVTWWPFITHLTGCQICCGVLNSQYDVENCHRHMERAYKIANNQVLQHSGFTYVSLQSSIVKHV